MNLLPLFHLAVNGCGTKTGLLPSLYDGLCADGSSEIQINSVSAIVIIIGNLVRILVAVSGALAVIVILVAAIYYITSTGDPARVKKAKDILTYTAVGLVLIIMSYSAITFITGNF